MSEDSAGNGFDVDAAIGFVRRIETLQAEVDEVLAKAKEDVEPIRQDIAAVKREAVDKGIGKRELAAVLRRRRHERKAEEAAAALDLAQLANYEQIIAALERVAEQMGPLGQSALERARAGA